MEGRLSEAEAGYRAIRAREPANPAVEFNLGIVLRRLGRLEEAVDALQVGSGAQSTLPRGAQQPRKRSARPWTGDESVVSLKGALAERPSFADAWNNLGAALKEQGQIEQAVACLENTVRLQPENASFHSNCVFAQHHRVGVTPADLLRVAV